MSKLRPVIRKVDSNHAEIISKIRKHEGVSVLDIHQIGKGAPDAFVSTKGITIAIEIKSSYRDRQTPAEIEFQKRWKGKYYVIWSYEQLCKILGIKP